MGKGYRWGVLLLAFFLLYSLHTYAAWQSCIETQGGCTGADCGNWITSCTSCDPGTNCVSPQYLRYGAQCCDGNICKLIYECVPCGLNGQPKCDQGAPCGAWLQPENGICTPCGGHTEPACGGSGPYKCGGDCKPGTGMNVAGICWNDGANSCGREGQYTCSYAYPTTPPYSSIVCDPCDSSLEACGNRCQDRSTAYLSDSNNCGSCGHICAANQVCTNGNCGCAPGTCSYAGTCYANGAAHPAISCQVCSNGAWTTAPNGNSCSRGGTCCSGSCITDISSNVNNCGACGNVCDAEGGYACTSGTCTKPSSIGTWSYPQFPGCGCASRGTDNNGNTMYWASCPDGRCWYGCGFDSRCAGNNAPPYPMPSTNGFYCSIQLSVGMDGGPGYYTWGQSACTGDPCGPGLTLRLASQGGDNKCHQCGDSVCSPGETYLNCRQDCPPTCPGNCPWCSGCVDPNSGMCVGAGLTCGGGKTCNSVTHQCVACSNNGECDDGNSCTNGLCVNAGQSSAYCTTSDAPVNTVCDSDSNSCTADVCDGAGSCVHPNEPVGTTCGGGVCSGTGSCCAGCSIGGTCYANGASNPANNCQSCNTVSSRTAWTNKANGVACTADAYSCTSDVCNGAGSCTHPLNAGSCLISGTCYANGVNNPGNECQWCQSTTPNSWVNKASGVVCTADANQCTSDICNGAGSCTHPATPVGTSCTEGACNTLTVCIDCDQDNDQYNRSYVENGVELCRPTIKGLDCNDANAVINPGRTEVCADSVENNCNGEADYDGFTSGTISPAVHGDVACAVGVSNIRRPAIIPLNFAFPVNCTSSASSVRSISFVGSAGVTCDGNSAVWSGTTVTVPCRTSVTTGSISCSVDSTKSYVLGTTQTTSFAPADVVNCDQDADSYNRTDQSSVCTNGNDCNDGNAAINPGRAEVCTDTIDNNCNNEIDYDGAGTGKHGDAACPVQVTGATVTSPVCTGANGNVLGTCSYNVVSAAALATLNRTSQVVGCTLLSWSGTTATVNCSTSAFTSGLITGMCGVNRAVSYQTGNNISGVIQVNGPGGACGTQGTCGATGICMICDQDSDGYNRTDQPSVCTNGNDCQDSVQGTLNNTGGYVAGNLIHPGATQIIGNGVSEDCTGCDPYASMQWNGQLLNNFNQPITGSVRLDNGQFVAVPGGQISLTVPYGFHNLTGNATDYDRITISNVLFSCSNPTRQNITLVPAQCQSDCSLRGYCDFSCVGKNGCALNSSQTPQERGNATQICAYADVGSKFTFNSTHTVVCCVGPIAPKTSSGTALTIQSNAPVVIFHKTGIIVDGQFKYLTTISYEKPD
jgi:hypothetical protein